jgi:Proteasome stabiliser
MAPADYRVARTELFRFDQNQADLKIILAFFLDVMLYNPPTVNDQRRAAMEARASARDAARDAARDDQSNSVFELPAESYPQTFQGTAPTENIPVSVIPDGLSPHAVAEVTKDGKVTWTSSRLSDAKVR